MKHILPLLCLAVASCGPIVEVSASSTRYRSFSDSEISSGGRIFVTDHNITAGTYPNSLYSKARARCAAVLGEKGFNEVNSKPVEYLANVSFNLNHTSSIWVYTAKVELWENAPPSYDHKWVGKGMAVCPPGEGESEEMWLKALEAALKRFPNS